MSSVALEFPEVYFLLLFGKQNNCNCVSNSNRNGLAFSIPKCLKANALAQRHTQNADEWLQIPTHLRSNRFILVDNICELFSCIFHLKMSRIGIRYGISIAIQHSNKKNRTPWTAVMGNVLTFALQLRVALRISTKSERETERQSERARCNFVIDR